MGNTETVSNQSMLLLSFPREGTHRLHDRHTHSRTRVHACSQFFQEDYASVGTPGSPTTDVTAAVRRGVRLSSFLSPQFPWAFDAIQVLRALNYLRPPLVIVPTWKSYRGLDMTVWKFPSKTDLTLSRLTSGSAGHLVRCSAKSPP